MSDEQVITYELEGDLALIGPGLDGRQLPGIARETRKRTCSTPSSHCTDRRTTPLIKGVRIPS